MSSHHPASNTMDVGTVFPGMFKLLLPLAIAVLVYSKLRPRRNLPLPPGPKKWPLLGNLLDLPGSYEWQAYAKWSKEYDSGIIHLRVPGRDIIVLNTAKVTNDLFEKRSSIYSSRPQRTLVNKLLGFSWLMSAMEYGEPWRHRRRLLQQYFRSQNHAFHEPRQIEAIRKMLPQLLDAPEKFMAITRHTVAGLSLSLAYGLNIKTDDDPYVNVAQQAADAITQASVPGRFLVEFFPALQYVPEWFPGTEWKQTVRKWRKVQQDLREVPFKATLAEMTNSSAPASFTSECLRDVDPAGDVPQQREAIQDTAGIIFVAGADTSVTSVQTFIAAMLCFPKAQRKAQEELDRVLKGRLPEFSDEKDLPYIAALVKEVLRWHPATPIAVPHYASSDDIYDGYRIPKGALVIGNVWALLHDENVYPNPSDFRPERFLKDGQLDPSVRDPAKIAFGFGRRFCPGAAIATSTLWLIAASILSTFDISNALDSQGNPIPAEIHWETGIISRPSPFKCTIKPRSSSAEATIRSAAAAF